MTNRACIILGFLVISISSCGGVNASPDSYKENITEAQEPVNSPKIVLHGQEITFNGKPIKLGDSLENWEQFLGKHNRTTFPETPDETGNTFYWTDSGIYGFMWKKTMDTLAIRINRKPPDPYRIYQKNEEPIDPGMFQGYLEIDGIQIRSDSTVSEINESLKKRGRGRINLFRCMRGLRLCSMLVEIDSEIHMVIHIGTDGKKYNGTIYEVQFSPPIEPQPNP
jgi:hypothetical protein